MYISAHVVLICKRSGIPGNAIKSPCDVGMFYGSAVNSCVLLQALLKAFLPNLRSNSPAARRTAASSLSLVCQYSRKPQAFWIYLLSLLLGMWHELRNCCFQFRTFGNEKKKIIWVRFLMGNVDLRIWCIKFV